MGRRGRDDFGARGGRELGCEGADGGATAPDYEGLVGWGGVEGWEGEAETFAFGRGGAEADQRGVDCEREDGALGVGDGGGEVGGGLRGDAGEVLEAAVLRVAGCEAGAVTLYIGLAFRGGFPYFVWNRMKVCSKGERKEENIRSHPIPLLKPLDITPRLDDFAGDIAAQDRRPLLHEDAIVLDLPVHGVDGGGEDAHDQVVGAGLRHVGCGDTERLGGAVEPGGLVTGLVVRHCLFLLLLFSLGYWINGVDLSDYAKARLFNGVDKQDTG